MNICPGGQASRKQPQGMDVSYFQQLSTSYLVCSHQRKKGAESRLLAFQAPGTGSPGSLEVRVRARQGWCWAVVRWVVCFLSFLAYLRLIMIGQEGGLLKCLAALGFGEQGLVGPRGQLFFKIPDKSTVIFDSGKVGKQEIGYLFLPPGGCSS